MPTKPQRKTYLVDRKVQGGLLIKAATYWLLSLAVVGGLTFIGWIFVAPGVDVLVQVREHLPSLFGMVVVAILCSLMVLPVLLYDLSKHTNRFAGPVFRLKRHLQALAEGQSVAPLSFREGDYWAEIAESFNGVLRKLQALEREQKVRYESTEFDTLPATTFAEVAGPK